MVSLEAAQEKARQLHAWDPEQFWDVCKDETTGSYVPRAVVNTAVGLPIDNGDLEPVWTIAPDGYEFYL